MGKEAHPIAYMLTYGPVPDGKIIDHRCWTRNCVNPKHLRAVTREQNQQNLSGKRSNNTSGYRGVTLEKRTGRWRARVKQHGRDYNAGTYDTAEAAAEAARLLRLKLRGQRNPPYRWEATRPTTHALRGTDERNIMPNIIHTAGTDIITRRPHETTGADITVDPGTGAFLEIDRVAECSHLHLGVDTITIGDVAIPAAAVPALIDALRELISRPEPGYFTATVEI